jgi:RNA-binding protein
MIVTKTLRKLGKVKELFGPEQNPYISVRLFKDIKEPELTKLKNERVYLA